MIEQIGTPLEIYRDPATSFVADFIGTMNFVAAEVAGAASARVGELELTCDLDGLPAGGAITLAVRPEDIVVRDVAGNEENSFAARVAEMEFLGSFYRALLSGGELGSAGLKADLSINLVRRLDLGEGQEIRVMIPLSRSVSILKARSMTSLALDGAAGPTVKPKVSRDDWTMRAFMGVIGLYLVVALALPLYAMFSKSFETYSFPLSQVEFQVDDGSGWGEPLNALELGEALGKFDRDRLDTSDGAQIQVTEFFPDFSFLAETKYRVRLLESGVGRIQAGGEAITDTDWHEFSSNDSGGSRSGRARASVSPTSAPTSRPRRCSPRSSTR